jgi:hypothetical protein
VVAGSPKGHDVGELQVARFACAQPATSQELDDEPLQRVRRRPRQLDHAGGLDVIKGLGEGIGQPGEIAGQEQLRRRLRPLPLPQEAKDALEAVEPAVAGRQGPPLLVPFAAATALLEHPAQVRLDVAAAVQLAKVCDLGELARQPPEEPT